MPMAYYFEHKSESSDSHDQVAICGLRVTARLMSSLRPVFLRCLIMNHGQVVKLPVLLDFVFYRSRDAAHTTL